MERKKIAFFGSSINSLAYLESLSSNPWIEIVLVVSQPDKPRGRGFESQSTPTKVWAQKDNILTLTPTELNDPLFLAAIKTRPLDLGLSAYYGLKIPKEVIDRFPLGILNVHHSWLPKHRGPNPIPWTILSKDVKTGTSLVKIDEKFDAGELVAQAEAEVLSHDTTGSLRARLDQKALALLEKFLPQYLEGKIRLKKQDPVSGSYEAKITKEMAKIDWTEPADLIERKIRAFDPWPVAWTMLNELLSQLKVKSEKPVLPRTEFTLKVHSQETRHEVSKVEGSKVNHKRVKILKSHLDEEKKLVIEKLQIEGKKPIGWREFLDGYVVNNPVI